MRRTAGVDSLNGLLMLSTERRTISQNSRLAAHSYRTYTDHHEAQSSTLRDALPFAGESGGDDWLRYTCRHNKDCAGVMIDKSTPAFNDLEPLGSALGFVDEIQKVVEQLSLFDGFTLSDYTMLCEYMECFGARRNVTLLTEGTKGDFLIVVLTGEVEVIKETDQSKKKRVTRVGPGSFLGEMSLIDGQRRFASCITTKPTDFAVLTRQRLNDIIAEHPQLATKLLLVLLQLITTRLRDATTRMLPTISGESI